MTAQVVSMMRINISNFVTLMCRTGILALPATAGQSSLPENGGAKQSA
jgi:hypothetical protein